MKNKIIALLTLFICCLAISLMWNHFIYEKNTTQNQPAMQSQMTKGEYSQNSEQSYLDPALMEQARKIIDEHDTIDEATKQQLYALNLNDQDIEMLVQIKNINKNSETASPTFRIPPLLASFLLFFIILAGYSITSHFLKH